MINIKYNYECPTLRGYKKFKISRKDQNEIFEYRKWHWAYTYEYYFKNDTILMYKVPNILACLISTLLFPVGLLLEGLHNYKEVYEDMVVGVWQSKKYGKFSSDALYKNKSDVFSKVLEAGGINEPILET